MKSLYDEALRRELSKLIEKFQLIFVVTLTFLPMGK